MPRTDRRGRDRDRDRDHQRHTAPTACPCGIGKPYDDCCGALHAGRTTAGTAEQLMRSRYSAFAVKDAAYLLKTWHSSTRPAHMEFDPKVRWSGLDIVSTTGGTAFHTDGTVEFVAHYAESGRPGSMRENSSFVREDGNWVYLSAL